MFKDILEKLYNNNTKINKKSFIKTNLLNKIVVKKDLINFILCLKQIRYVGGYFFQNNPLLRNTCIITTI